MDKILKNALFFEFQGHRNEALKYYKYILLNDSHHKEANLAVNRLSGNRKKFLGINKERKEFFINADIENLKEFEKWLIMN